MSRFRRFLSFTHDTCFFAEKSDGGDSLVRNFLNVLDDIANFNFFSCDVDHPERSGSTHGRRSGRCMTRTSTGRE